MASTTARTSCPRPRCCCRRRSRSESWPPRAQPWGRPSRPRQHAGGAGAGIRTWLAGRPAEIANTRWSGNVNPMSRIPGADMTGSSTSSGSKERLSRTSRRARPTTARARTRCRWSRAIGKAVQFDGENNVNFPDLGRFTRHTPFTIAFWMNDPRLVDGAGGGVPGVRRHGCRAARLRPDCWTRAADGAAVPPLARQRDRACGHGRRSRRARGRTSR